MSDSEIESVFGESSAASSSSKYQKKRKTAIRTRSDSECEAEPTSSASKRKRVSKPRAPPKRSKDLFGLLSDEDESVAIENSQRQSSTARQQLDSSLTSKVANGCVRRSAALDGAYYVEVRAYSTSDALKAPPAERYKKALLTAKVQLNTGTSEWHDLQKFMKSLKKLFEDREPVFYSNKINIK